MFYSKCKVWEINYDLQPDIDVGKALVIFWNKIIRELLISRSSPPEVFRKKGVLRNFAKFTGKHQWQSLFFNVAGWSFWRFFIKKETLAQVFSCEVCEISKNICFTEHLEWLPLHLSS